MKLEDPSLIVVDEGTWNNVTTKYSAHNSGGVELEVGDFLYGMVRVLKPEHILETGTHKGISSSYMGLGLKDNGFGHLDTWEIYPGNKEEADRRFVTLGIQDFVTCHLEDFRTATPIDNYGLVLLDSEPVFRFHELVRIFDNVIPGGYIFIHDLHSHLSQINDCQPFGKLPEQISEWLREDRLRIFNLPNPRGMAGFYKVADGDYDPFQLTGE